MSFLDSVFTEKNPVMPTDEVDSWITSILKEQPFKVSPIPLEVLRDWTIDPTTKDISHRSGRFFRVEGLLFKTNWRMNQEWVQPILNQAEIGVLGLLTRVVDGQRYFLMQAKQEPGNLGPLQIAPTLQATQSNYMQVHRGAVPQYFEYFKNQVLGGGGNSSLTLLDHVQSEHGTRFLRKRTRSLIVEVDGDVPIHKNFAWFTLAQLQSFSQKSNFLNMNSRSILASSFCLLQTEVFDRQLSDSNLFLGEGFGVRLLRSLVSLQGLHTFDDVAAWFSKMRSSCKVETRSLPLRDSGWQLRNGELQDPTGDLFSVIGVDIEAHGREVTRWNQPLVRSSKRGLVGFLVQMKNGVLHFLVQAMGAPGSIEALELGPTLSYHGENGLPFLGHFSVCCAEDVTSSARQGGGVEESAFVVRHHSIQSLEGGRFYHDENEMMVIEISEHLPVIIPEGYCWMTLGQLTSFLKTTNFVHIEVRELLACLKLSSHVESTIEFKRETVRTV